MSRASDAWAAMTTAMIDTDPACKNDDRFILDDQPAESLAYICRACPLFDLCLDYANLERPKAGIWAGKKYRQNNTKERDFENEHAV